MTTAKKMTIERYLEKIARYSDDEYGRLVRNQLCTAPGFLSHPDDCSVHEMVIDDGGKQYGNSPALAAFEPTLKILDTAVLL